MLTRKLMLTMVILGLMVAPAWSESDADLAAAVYKKKEMIVTANPLATAAGAKILKKGGTAVDAMIVAQTVLGLVEPQSSGIGGGAFVVYYDARTDEVTTFDGREKAPMAATADRFLDGEGNSIGWYTAWQSGLSVGVPGVPRLMEEMHERYGRLPWRLLFAPAKWLAQRGYALTERTSDQVAGLLARNVTDEQQDPCHEGRVYFRDPAAFSYFVDEETCTAKPAGTFMRNPAYADTMNILAHEGADGFYYGPVAEDIAAAVQGDLAIAGDLAVQDLAAYEVVERSPVCLNYRGYTVCGMGPPSSGGLAVGQMLGILENFDLEGYEVLDPQMVHLFAQAGRLAFADRGKYVGDIDFVNVPIAGMLDEAYLAERAGLITLTEDMGTAAAGTPPDVMVASLGADNRAKNSGTSHISIVDRYGNALSMTTSVESSFGSGLMVRGFMLNNQLTDFSFSYEDDDGNPIANRVGPGKRPRSSMSPTIVFDEDGDVELVTGSPGGSRIIGYTAQSIINVLDFGLDPQEAINVPHYTNRNGYTEVETPIDGITWAYDAEALAQTLSNDYGYEDVRISTLTSGLSAIQVEELKRGKKKKERPGKGNTVLVGGADKRRDGTVGGR